MPCHGATSRFEGRAWCDRLAAVRREMVKAGWIERSLKFGEVSMRKARKTFP